MYGLLQRINAYLMRQARKKYRRPGWHRRNHPDLPSDRWAAQDPRNLITEMNEQQQVLHEALDLATDATAGTQAPPGHHSRR